MLIRSIPLNLKAHQEAMAARPRNIRATRTRHRTLHSLMWRAWAKYAQWQASRFSLPAATISAALPPQQITLELAPADGDLLKQEAVAALLDATIYAVALDVYVHEPTPSWWRLAAYLEIVSEWADDREDPPEWSGYEVPLSTLLTLLETLTGKDSIDDAIFAAHANHIMEAYPT